MRLKRLLFGALSATSLLLPGAALAASPTLSSTSATFKDLVGFLIGYVNIIIPVLIAAAVLFYMKNTAAGIFKLRNGEVDPDWKQSMIWGIVAILLIVSICGILTILANTFQIPINT